MLTSVPKRSDSRSVAICAIFVSTRSLANTPNTTKTTTITLPTTIPVISQNRFISSALHTQRAKVLLFFDMCKNFCTFLLLIDKL